VQTHLKAEAVAEARRWFGEADEEPLVATVLAGNEQVPARAACFHSHLAAEKSLKAMVILRGYYCRSRTISSGWCSCSRWMTGDFVRDLLSRATRVVDAARPAIG